MAQAISVELSIGCLLSLGDEISVNIVNRYGVGLVPAGPDDEVSSFDVHLLLFNSPRFNELYSLFFSGRYFLEEFFRVSPQSGVGVLVVIVLGRQVSLEAVVTFRISVLNTVEKYLDRVPVKDLDLRFLEFKKVLVFKSPVVELESAKANTLALARIFAAFSTLAAFGTGLDFLEGSSWNAFDADLASVSLVGRRAVKEHPQARKSGVTSANDHDLPLAG